MKCPRCKSESEVLETRDGKRRRAYLNRTCRYRWSTVELSAEEVGKLRADGVRLARVRVLANEGRS